MNFADLVDFNPLIYTDCKLGIFLIFRDVAVISTHSYTRIARGGGKL